MGRRKPLIVDGERKLLGGKQHQQDAEPGAENGHASQCHGQAEKLISAVLDVVHSFVNQYKANNDQNQRFQQRNLWWVKFTACVVALYTTVTTLQYCALMEANRMTRENFQKAQRAAVYLGLEDGKFMEFASPREDERRVVLYLRNYGSSVARGVRVLLYAVTAALNDYMIEAIIPPVAEWEGLTPGLDLPPGFPYTGVRDLPSPTPRMDLEEGSMNLVILVRISYSDVFGSYCDDFVISYDWRSRGFQLGPGHRLCDGNTHQILFCSNEWGLVGLEETSETSSSQFECKNGWRKKEP